MAEEIKLHDFDGDIPTEKWLLSIGFVHAESEMGSNYHDDLVLGRVRLSEFHHGDCVWVMAGADWFEMKTKAQVLALLAATDTKIEQPANWLGEGEKG